MSIERFANNAQTQLNGLVGSGDVMITVTSATGFPSSPQFRILIDSELLIVTAGGAGSTTWTVSRGAEGTAATSHSNGATVTLVLTAGGLENLDTSYIATGTLSTARLGSGTANSTTFLRGDQTWAIAGGIPGGGNGAVQFNSNGTFGGDASRLYWDEATGRLGIGAAPDTSSPTQRVLEISGNATSVPGKALVRNSDFSQFSYLSSGTAGGNPSFVWAGGKVMQFLTQTNPYSGGTTTSLGSWDANGLSIGAVGTPPSQHYVLSNSASRPVQILQGAASQTADLWELQDSVGNVLGRGDSSGNMAFGQSALDTKYKVSVNPDPVTVANPSTNPSGVINYIPNGAGADTSPGIVYDAGGGYTANNYSWEIRVWPYKIINGTKYVAASYSDSGVFTDDGSTNPYYLSYSWTDVSVDGYFVQLSSTDLGYTFDYYYDAGNTTSLVDGQGGVYVSWVAGDPTTNQPYAASGKSHTIRQYDYKLTAAGKLYSPSGATSATVTDDGSGLAYWIAWTLTSGSGIDGHRVLKSDDYNPHSYDVHYDIAANSFNEVNNANPGWATGATVTPSSPGLQGALKTEQGISHFGGQVQFVNDNASSDDLCQWIDGSGNINSFVQSDGTAMGVNVQDHDLTDSIAGTPDTVKIVKSGNYWGFTDGAAGTGQGYISVSNGTIKGFGAGLNGTDGFIMGTFTSHRCTIRGASNKNIIQIDPAGRTYVSVFGPTSAATVNAQLHVKSSTSSTKTFIAQGTTSQSADLIEAQNSAGTALFSVNQNGMYSGNMDTMTYAATISLDVTLGNVHKVTATGNATINASAAGIAGQHMWILIVNDATSARTITFGTSFKSSGTLTGSISKAATIHFISDGSNWYEVSRTLNL